MLRRVEQRLQVVTLGVRDLARSRAFYRDGLGWEPLLEVDDEVSFFQVGPGLLLALFGAVDLATDVGVEDPARVSDQTVSRMSLGHNMDSEAAVDSELAKAVAAGGTILKPGQRAAFGGYHGYLADPDGFQWEIGYNAGLVFGADGTIRFTEAES
jgi:catechol 2,3-dioxygenase-like lactoylglutathione lyase family enzyme